MGIDDASAFLARFANGSLATFEATRYARGHKALYTLEINGENASIAWDLHDLHRLQYFDHRDEGRLRGWRSIPRHRRRPSLHEALVGAGPADRLRTHLHPPGGGLPGRPRRRHADRPTFREALATDYVTDAVLQSAQVGTLGDGSTLAASGGPRHRKGPLRMPRIERRTLIAKFEDMVRRRVPIVGAGAGTGLSAKCEEEGGIDLIVIYNSGRYRMAGRGSLAGMLAYGNANEIVMEMAREVLPVVRRTPVLAGVERHRPVLPLRPFPQLAEGGRLFRRAELPHGRADRRHLSGQPRRNRDGLSDSRST